MYFYGLITRKDVSLPADKEFCFVLVQQIHPAKKKLRQNKCLKYDPVIMALVILINVSFVPKGIIPPLNTVGIHVVNMFTIYQFEYMIMNIRVIWFGGQLGVG